MSGPTVVAFSGHRVDAAGRAKPRFPPSAERKVREAILAALTSWKASIGYSSAADGSDILFLEALDEIGAEANIVLPHPPDAFIATSVASNGNWIARFEKALARARTVTVISQRVGDAVSYQFASMVLAGIARIRASQSRGALRGLVVWDLQAGAPVGTGTAASDWLRSGIPVERLSPSPEGAPIRLDSSHCVTPPSKAAAAGDERIVSVVCADGTTVFDSVTEANDFAMGLSGSRVVVHSGVAPLVEALDAVVRIASLAPAGCVYCTEPHAALVALENAGRYSCEYVGSGDTPVYRLRRGEPLTARAS